MQDIEKAIEQDSGEALPQGVEEVEFTDDEMDDNSALSLADEKARHDHPYVVLTRVITARNARPGSGATSTAPPHRTPTNAAATRTSGGPHHPAG